MPERREKAKTDAERVWDMFDRMWAVNTTADAMRFIAAFETLRKKFPEAAAEVSRQIVAARGNEQLTEEQKTILGHVRRAIDIRDVPPPSPRRRVAFVATPGMLKKYSERPERRDAVDTAWLSKLLGSNRSLITEIRTERIDSIAWKSNARVFTPLKENVCVNKDTITIVFENNEKRMLVVSVPVAAKKPG